MARACVIFGCAGPELTEAERQLFSDLQPMGFILFARNCLHPDQVRELTKALRACVDGPCLMLIDQEGGRVQRMTTPHWPIYPAPRRFGELYQHDPRSALEAAQLYAQLMATDLLAVGLNVNCIPLLDVDFPYTHKVIGERSFGTGVDQVAALGRAVCDGCLEAGVLPVVKHIPGHGRAVADSHKDLPHVEASSEALFTVDAAPFRALKDVPLAMIAHILYTNWDNQRPATISPDIISNVIRRFIGFDGLLLTDDLSMGALSGPLDTRTRLALEAGCDVALHCNGEYTEMCDLARGLPEITETVLGRFERAVAKMSVSEPLTPRQYRRGHARLDELLGTARAAVAQGGTRTSAGT